MKLYQWTSDIWTGETSPEKVGKAEGVAWKVLNKAEIEIPPRKCHWLSKLIFLGTWWIAGSAVIPSDTLQKNQRDVSALIKKGVTIIYGILGYWRVFYHFPSIILTLWFLQHVHILSVIVYVILKDFQF